MNASNANKVNFDPVNDEKNGKIREVGSQAVWSLSSCKPGFGVEQLRDNCYDTYWQSDGPQPHLVNIQFRKKTTIEYISIYADYKLDESYTPSRLSIRTGNHFHDLQEVELMELNEPNGWVVIKLNSRAFLVQIAILTNHQNGRDTHIRQIKIHSSVNHSPAMIIPAPFDFTTTTFKQHSTIR
ncbi:anaphase-promoting complex subunit 10-like isoform X3 [Dinothrombium tinctorium]|uniref:Anaphase-promoting complex subunit 10 n=1 Tax=Dinothrombium tinctorium TaxID=1965070 RepID=A0A443RGR3_9ACAR|nr:anaphase-promoting complex subunit 10-like isoform X3 [Dinothrombium tinctorium]